MPRAQLAQSTAPEFPLCLSRVWVADYLPLGVGCTCRLQGIDRHLSLLQQGTLGLWQGETGIAGEMVLGMGAFMAVGATF